MPRYSILRTIIPRLSRPLLPVSRITTPHLSHPRASPKFFPRSFSISRPSLTIPPRSPLSQEPQTLSARLKLLIKTYGWYALGMYTILSVLDFGVSFAAINLLGAEHVAHLAASVKATFINLIGREPPSPSESPEHQAGGHEGLYAMLLLAWTVHKTLFLPVRVGLTAALTPRFVGWLGSRGWTGSEGARRAAQEMRQRMRRGSRGPESPSD